MKTAKPKTPKKQAGWDRIEDRHRVIGLDVSSSAAGWAVGWRIGKTIEVIDFGLIRPPSTWKSAEMSSRRIEYITKQIEEACVRYRCAHLDDPVARVVMEWQSHMRAARGRNVNGLAVLGQAQGSVWRHLLNLDYEVDLVSERQWTCVNGWPARKEHRAKLIRLAVPEYRKAVEADENLDTGLDIADAIGILLHRLSV